MSNKNETGAAEWPPFETLDVSVAPEWLGKSIHELITAHGERLLRVVVELWGTYYYCDQHNYYLHGAITPIWQNPLDRPSEDELDHVPAMRRMGRLAEDLWDGVPMDLDEEGGMPGELDYRFDHEGVHFSWDSHDYGGTCNYSASAIWKDGQWHYEERIVMPDIDVTETALAIGDTQGILEQVDPGDAGLKSWPENAQLTSEFDENEDFVLIANGGGLFDLYERSVA